MQDYCQQDRYDLPRVYMTQGRRGSISRLVVDGIAYCKKESLSSLYISNIQREIGILKKIKSLNLTGYTELIYATDTRFVAKWIEGVAFDTARQDPRFLQSSLLLQLLERAYILDTHGIEQGELHRPMANVLVDIYGQVTVIDFDQGNISGNKNKNLRHLAQWMLTQGYIQKAMMPTIGKMAREDIYIHLISLVNIGQR